MAGLMKEIFSLRCQIILRLTALMVFCYPVLANADVKLPRIFSDRAVLQRDQPLPVWGWADPGEKVAVTLGAEHATAVTDQNGRWSVTLAAQPMSKKPLKLTVEGNNTVEVADLLVGDVWLCSGQSNMEFPLGACDADADIRTADFPLIRQFGVEYNFAQAPQTDVKGQ
jgi:sialate O-acetylesterase